MLQEAKLHKKTYDFLAAVTEIFRVLSPGDFSLAKAGIIVL
jgi:hypothetical protein